MILLVLILLSSPCTECQFNQKPQYNIKDSLIINALVHSNVSLLPALMNWKQPEGCKYVRLISNGKCNDGKIG